MTVPPLLPDVADQLALLLRASLLIGGAWAAAAALRKVGASAAARHMAWLLGIAALLALPVLWFLMPALRLPILPAEAATAGASVASSPGTASPPFLLAGPLSADVPIDAGWSMALLAIYALGTATLLVRFFIGRRMLKRLWSDAGAAKDPAWEKLISQLSSGMRLCRRVELRISRGPAVPMTWGTLAPKVLLPAEASEWPPERRRLVLLHELAHVARRDSFSRSAASLACALYWFHPGAWFAARQMRMEQEHAADDRVLMAGGSPKAYALSLLHLARGPGARPRFDQAAAMAGMYQLERRLVSITGASRRNRPGTFFLSSSALLAGLATLLVAAGVPVSASPTLPAPFRAQRMDRNPSLDSGVDARRAEDSSIRRPKSDAPAPAGSGDAVERLARESAAAPDSRPGGPAPKAGEIAGRSPLRPDGSVPGEGDRTNLGEDGIRDRRQSPAPEQQLRSYGWELPRPDSQAQTGFPAASSRPARLVVPAPLRRPAASERARLPKWTQILPRLVPADKSTSSGSPSSQGTKLSWSIDVGAP